MTRRLKVNVMLSSISAEGVFYPATTPEAAMPPEHAAQIGAHAWAEDDRPVPPAPPSLPQREMHITATPPSVVTEPEGLVQEPEVVAPVDLDEDPTDDPDEADEPKPESVGTPPALGGPGSSAKAWHAYATANGVELADDAKKGDIIDALKSAGIPTE